MYKREREFKLELDLSGLGGGKLDQPRGLKILFLLQLLISGP